MPDGQLMAGTAVVAVPLLSTGKSTGLPKKPDPPPTMPPKPEEVPPPVIAPRPDDDPPPTRPPRPEDEPPPTMPPSPEDDPPLMTPGNPPEAPSLVMPLKGDEPVLPPVIPLICEFTRERPTATAASVVDPPPSMTLPAVIVSLPLSVEEVKDPGALLPIPLPIPLPKTPEA